MTVVAFVPDLMDRSRIAAVAPDTHFVRRADELLELVDQAALDHSAPPRLALVDLGRPGALDAVRRLTESGVAALGFASHVDHPLLEAGRAAGCSQVLARSVFFRRLPELLG